MLIKTNSIPPEQLLARIVAGIVPAHVAEDPELKKNISLRIDPKLLLTIDSFVEKSKLIGSKQSRTSVMVMLMELGMCAVNRELQSGELQFDQEVH